MFIKATLLEGGSLLFNSNSLIYAADFPPDISEEDEEGMPVCEVCLHMNDNETALFLVRGGAEDLFPGQVDPL